MAAAKEDLTIENGATFEKTWIYADSSRTPIPISTYEARMQIRERLEDATALVSLTSTPVAGIVLEANFSTGQIDIRIGADVTDALTFDRGVYDLELYNPIDLTEVYRLVGGTVILTQGVTR